MSMYFFLHPASGRSWSADDPHHWLLNRRDDDLLAAARERLLLSHGDPERCLRAVLRRCGLALVRVLAEDKIVIQHWSEPAPDLRGWVKEYGFNRPGVQVVLVNVKTGKVVVHEDAEDALLFGQGVSDTFPWREYAVKYERRMIEEGDDGTAAPAAWTNFVWPGAAHERLTWQVLKAIWRAESIPCPNCDVPLLVTSFAWQRGMLSFRSARVVRHCLRCRRQFESQEEKPLVWLAAVLGPQVRPTHLALWRQFGIEWADPAPPGFDDMCITMPGGWRSWAEVVCNVPRCCGRACAACKVGYRVVVFVRDGEGDADRVDAVRTL